MLSEHYNGLAAAIPPSSLPQNFLGVSGDTAPPGEPQIIQVGFLFVGRPVNSKIAEIEMRKAFEGSGAQSVKKVATRTYPLVWEEQPSAEQADWAEFYVSNETAGPFRLLYKKGYKGNPTTFSAARSSFQMLKELPNTGTVIWMQGTLPGAPSDEQLSQIAEAFGLAHARATTQYFDGISFSYTPPYGPSKVHPDKRVTLPHLAGGDGGYAFTFGKAIQPGFGWGGALTAAAVGFFLLRKKDRDLLYTGRG